VVEIPGTEDWDLNDANALDLTTDGRLLAALADDMSDAVLDAMRLSGIGPDEPVLLAGHSLGGMVAVSVAAAAGEAYSVRAVVTAGAPDIPRPVPSGVQVRHYRHDEDVVPDLDGMRNQTSASVTVVTRDLAASGGPAEPTPVEAHAMSRYVETAVDAEKQLAGSPGMRAFDAAVRDVLGPDGTTAVTRQFQATRDPALVAAQPPRLWPSS
jgi:pimeloyl-ACP methyl ester carboxylesterase